MQERKFKMKFSRISQKDKLQNAPHIVCWAARHLMKNTIIIGVMAATVLIVGCSKTDSSSSNPTGPNATKQKENQQPIVIRFGPGNTLFVAGAPCSQTELAARLTQLVGQQDTNVVVRVFGANTDDNRKAVTDACKKAGVHSIRYTQVNF